MRTGLGTCYLTKVQSRNIRRLVMILSSCPAAAEIADVVDCSERSIFAIKSKLRYLGSTKAASNGVGNITPPMLDEYLLEKPGLYQDEIVLFMLDEDNTHVIALA